MSAISRLNERLMTRLGFIRQSRDIQTFIAAMREAGGPAATLSDAVLERQYHDDDKGAFIAWFEGRPDFKPDDWALLLLAVRHCLPPFSEGGV